MSNLQELYKLLSDARDRRASGQLMVFASEGRASRSAKITIRNGEAELVQYRAQRGIKAFHTLLTLDIQRAILDEGGRWFSASRRGEKTDTQALLAVLRETISAQQAPPEPEPESELDPELAEALIEDALRLLESMIGNRAHYQVASFAHRHPPTSHPREFLDDCRSYISAIGARNRNAVLAELDELYSLIDW